MSKINQNSKWKAHQQPEPEVVIDKKKFASEPLKVVEVVTESPEESTITEQKPLVKKGKKTEE